MGGIDRGLAPKVPTHTARLGKIHDIRAALAVILRGRIAINRLAPRARPIINLFKTERSVLVFLSLGPLICKFCIMRRVIELNLRRVERLEREVAFLKRERTSRPAPEAKEEK